MSFGEISGVSRAFKLYLDFPPRCPKGPGRDPSVLSHHCQFGWRLGVSPCGQAPSNESQESWSVGSTMGRDGGNTRGLGVPSCASLLTGAGLPGGPGSNGNILRISRAGKNQRSNPKKVL